MSTEIKLHDRLIAIVATKETEEKLTNQTDWKKLGLDSLMVLGGSPIKSFGSPNNINLLKLAKTLFTNNIDPIYKTKIPYPVFDFDFVRKNFRFPPQHPKDGVVYACSEFEPDLYIPLASFHKYMYESKMSAFNEMCAFLGAKTCRVIYEEENGTVVTTHIGAEKIPTNVGTVNAELDFASKSNHNQKAIVFFTFPEPKEIVEFKSNWMNGEPSWNSLQKMRLERDVSIYTAEFSYLDEMGVNANLAGSLNGIGLNIGGTFEEIKRKKYKFEVEFWQKK